MKKVITVILLLVFLAGCTISNTSTTDDNSDSPNPASNESINTSNSEVGGTVEQSNQQEDISESTSFTINPVSNFTTEDINYLGVDCSGTENEIADCIKYWQVNNMIYYGVTEQSEAAVDSADALHWNYAIPGVFPTNQVIKHRVSEGMPYGVCYDFATIYCSIAQYYGLNCRVVNSKTKPSERPGSEVEYTTGLQYEEYERMEVELDRQGLDYDFILMNKVLRETPEHYWAEVYLDGEWEVMDASEDSSKSIGGTQVNYKNEGDWEVTDWNKFYSDSNIDYYLGLKDDLGDRIRLFEIGDYIFSNEYNLGLQVPYYETCESMCPFFQGTLSVDCVPDCNLFKSGYSCYETCSGDNFYIICDYICGETEDMAELVDCYENCSGLNWNFECDFSCFED